MSFAAAGRHEGKHPDPGRIGMAPTNINQAATVFVPVSDQERSLAFYVDTLGFEKRTDFTYAGGERWLEVIRPGAATAFALIGPRDGAAPGIETRVALGTADVEADHADLRARGVDVDDAILRAGDPVVTWGGATLAGVAPMFRLRDPDGNSFLIVQSPPGTS
jgi:catechol 2,3-dioxygenase-like lactoylglutathione lyase family enzyme